MSDRVILTWSFENWLMVSLMAIVGFAVFGLISQAIISAEKTRANKMLNMRLVGAWQNWFTITLMVMFAALAIHLVIGHKAKKSETSTNG